MKKKYTHWSDPENERKLRKAVKESKSLAEVLRKLNLVPVGGNYHNIKHHIARLNLDTTHHLGQGWNKDNYKNRDYANNDSWKKHLIRVRGHKCESCGNTEWMKQAIPLELEHIDGDRYNNDEKNLLLLCCNCHAQTKTWRRSK